MKTHLFINPAAGRWKGRKYAHRIIERLSRNDPSLKTTFSHTPKALVTDIKEACLKGCKSIFIAGGDGTIFEAVNGIMLAKEINPDINTSLGIIPLGTGNDFIKSAKIPNNWRKACDYLIKAEPQKVDVAKVITKNKSAYFINNIGSGFDAGIGITASKIPILRGKIVYVIGLIWHLIKGVPNPEIEYSIDGTSHKSKMTLTAVTNGTTYGGSFNIAPQARIDDGLLDAIIAPPLGRLTAIPLILRLLFGTHLKRKDVLHVQCKKFQLKSNIPIPVIADGEVIDEACMEYSVRILESKLCLLA